MILATGERQPAYGLGGHHAPMPVRQRIVTRARLLAFAGLLVVASLTLGLSWMVARSLASPSYAWLDLVHVGAFAALAVVAWFFAQRSTRVIEDLFHHEDRLMLAAVHEGNRPLSRLVAAVDEGLDGVVPAEAALKDVARHANALRELIEALVETARVAAGAIPLSEDLVCVDEVVADVERADTTGTATIVPDVRPVIVVGSARLLRLAVSNLVHNAVRHAYHGGPGEVMVRVDERGITVTDDGPGMDEDYLADLCPDGVWTGMRLGKSSLGLAITGWATEVHGGTLRLANRPEGGFEARIELPTQAVRADDHVGRVGS